MEKLTFKRNNKITDYLHKGTDKIIQFCLENELNTLIVGYNEFWKQHMKKVIPVNVVFWIMKK